jgi:hypothetical protein
MKTAAIYARVSSVEAIEIEENLHRRELSPALRKTSTTRLKALHEQEHPKSKGGRPSRTVPKVRRAGAAAARWAHCG